MKGKGISTLGYIMNFLKISTADTAHILHVDASLVSKWRTGSRAITEKSVYFEDIIQYILNNHSDEELGRALGSIFPHENLSGHDEIEHHLRYALSGKNNSRNKFKTQLLFGNAKEKTATAVCYEGNEGRRRATQEMLDYAESLSKPANLLFVDTEGFRWLWEDRNYSENFTERLKKLLKRNFRAVFTIQYSGSSNDFRNFFNIFSSVLFHQNASWNYFQYYDELIIGCSFFLINNAVSMFGSSAGREISQTMIFTDSDIVIRQEEMARHITSRCQPLFTDFRFAEMPEILADTPDFSQRGTFYAFLPVPAFFAVSPELVSEILSDNGIDSDSDIFRNIMEINSIARQRSLIHSENNIQKKNSFLIFQLEKLVESSKLKNIVSGSLSLACERKILISSEQYSKELRMLSEIIVKNQNIHIILASEKDGIFLPSINCWCQENSYIMQMLSDRMRICTETIAVTSATNALNQIIHMIPPERRDNISVAKFLSELADETLIQT